MISWPRLPAARLEGRVALIDMPKVRVFSTPFCPYCVTLKEFLKANKIEFDEFDVAQDEKARDDMIAKSKQMGVPVVEIDDQMIIGFDRQKISELLNIKI